MSKVISFSISDRYLDKLRSLYPSLTDNLAAKQFLTDRLDSSLGNSLDGSLDDGLDDRVKTLIESWVDGLLEVRLDAAMGKLITSLSERMARLEKRLDDSLDGRLDDNMEPLLKREKECSIAAPIPTGETSLGSSDQPAIGTLPTVETVEPISSIELDKGAIETVRSETDSSIDTGTGEAVTIGDKPWYTIDELLDYHYSGWPETKEGLRKKALTEGWPRRTRRGSKGHPYEYQAVLPE